MHCFVLCRPSFMYLHGIQENKRIVYCQMIFQTDLSPSYTLITRHWFICRATKCTSIPTVLYCIVHCVRLLRTSQLTQSRPITPTHTHIVRTLSTNYVTLYTIPGLPGPNTHTHTHTHRQTGVFDLSPEKWVIAANAIITYTSKIMKLTS